MLVIRAEIKRDQESKAVSREEREDGLTYEKLVILRLKPRQKIQGALGVVTALTSMYLFSVLGVQGDPKTTQTLGWLERLV